MRVAVLFYWIRYLDGYILIKSAVKVNVKQLCAIADCQDGLAGRKSVVEQRIVCVLALFVGRHVLGVSCAAKSPRLQVVGTARQHECVEGLCYSAQLRR